MGIQMQADEQKRDFFVVLHTFFISVLLFHLLKPIYNTKQNPLIFFGFTVAEPLEVEY